MIWIILCLLKPLLLIYLCFFSKTYNKCFTVLLLLTIISTVILFTLSKPLYYLLFWIWKQSFLFSSPLTWSWFVYYYYMNIWSSNFAICYLDYNSKLLNCSVSNYYFDKMQATNFITVLLLRFSWPMKIFLIR